MVTADEGAEQLGEVPNLDVKSFAVPRAGWAKAFEQFWDLRRVTVRVNVGAAQGYLRI